MANKISLLIKSESRSLAARGRFSSFIACAMFFLLPAQHAQSLEPKWPPGPYRYLVVDQDVREILTEFGRNLNISIQISDQVNGRRIRGRLPISSAKDFLNRLCESYGLVWYFDGGILHFSAENEVRTEAVDLGPVNPAGISQKLRDLEILDSRFPIRSTGDSRNLAISGPPPYLARIRQTVETMQKVSRPRNVREVQDGDDVKVRVFRGSTKEGS
jgi:type II secretory pathway component GspD/PulD (secretin)